MTGRRTTLSPLFVSALRARPSFAWLTTAWPYLAVAAVGFTATLWATALLWRRIDGLAAPAYDLGFFQQVVWNVGATGAWISSFQQGSFLGLHFSPILAVPAVMERLVGPDVRVLSLLHAIGIGALAPAAFLFLRAALRPSAVAAPIAAALAIGLPVWSTMQWVLRSDFHPELAGVVLALLAGWAGLSGRPRAMWILGLVALATREDVAYAIAVIGLVVVARGREPMRRHGRVLTVVAVTWGVVVFGLVMPWLRDGVLSDTAGYYGWLGNGSSVLTAPLTMSDRIVAALTRPTAWFVVAGMLIALVGLPLLRPRWMLLVVPPLVAALLSSHPPQAALILQYPLILLIPLLAAAAMGARRALAIVGRSRRRLRARRRARRPRLFSARRTAVVPLAVLVLAWPAIVGAWVQGSIPPFIGADAAFLGRAPAMDELRAFAVNVPADAFLVADEGLVAPLAARPSIRRLTATERPPPQTFLLIDRLAWSPSRDSAARRERILETLPTSGRPRIADDGRFVLWGPQPEGTTP